MASRIALKAKPSRSKAGRIVRPRQLLELGTTLMAEADAALAEDPRSAALAYRNGLLIALMALVPLRSGNFSQMEFGRHLARLGDGIRVAFAAGEMKTHRPLEVAFRARCSSLWIAISPCSAQSLRDPSTPLPCGRRAMAGQCRSPRSA